MTVNTQDITSGPYTGNGITDTFAYDFPITAKTELRVIQTDTNGVQTLLTVDTDYTVTGVGSNTGGNVVTTSPLTDEYTLYIRSDIDSTQNTEFESQGGFFPDVHESAMDKLTLLVQQLEDRVGRSFRLGDDLAIDGVFQLNRTATQRANNVLRFDENGDLVDTPAGELPVQVIDDLDDRYTPVVATLSVLEGATWVDIAGNTIVKRVGMFIETVEYSAGNGGGNKFKLMDAGSPGARPTAIRGYIVHVSGGSGGLYLEGLFPEGFKATQFGAGTGSVTEDTAAFNAMIAYANANGGNDANNVPGFTFILPNNTYTLNALDPVIVSGVFFVGESSGGVTLRMTNGADTFTWGNGVDIVVGFGVGQVKYEYLSIAGASTVHKLSYAFRGFFTSSLLVNIGTFISAGTSDTATAGGIFCSDITGSVANIGVPLFDLRWGAGLHMVNVGAFVSGVGAPTHNAGTPGVITEWPNSNPPVDGRSVFRCADGFWDTTQATNCIFERFDTGLSIAPNVSKVYQAFLFNNVVMDYFKRFCIDANAQSNSTISNIVTDKTCWFVSWQTDALRFIGGGFNDNHDIGGKVVTAGIRGVFYDVQAPATRNNMFDKLRVNGCNRLGTASGAMEFANNSKGFKVLGAHGNIDDTASGITWRAPFGLQVGVDADGYIVADCDLEGSTNGYNILAPTVASTLGRKIRNNKNANYAGHDGTFTIPASGVRHTNITPFDEELYFFGGTITGRYDKNLVGFPGGLQYLKLDLEPGDNFAVGYSVAPTVKRFVKS